MKSFLIVSILSALSVCAFPQSESSSSPQQPQTQPQPQQQQPPSLVQPSGQQEQQQAAPAQQPNAPGPPPQQEPEQQGPPSTGRKVQAKTKPEYDAYQAADAVVTGDPDFAKGEAAAADFQTKFPQSDLTSILYDKLMKRYSQANNGPKTAEMGRKELALDPQSLPALLTVASVVSQTAHPSDLDYKDRYQEVLKDANQALEELNNPATAPQGFAPDQLNSLKALAYAAIGNMEFVQAGEENANPADRAQHDAAAEQALKQSTALNASNPDPGEWLRLAVTLDHQKKYAEALDAANKAVQFAGSEPNVLTLAQQEQTRLKALAPAPPANAPTPH